eukprot:110572_1
MSDTDSSEDSMSDTDSSEDSMSDTDSSEDSMSDTDSSEDSEDSEKSKYNLIEIKNRLQLQENKGHQKVNTFSKEIRHALQLSFSYYTNDISNKLINIILTYSNHQQIIDQYHKICNRLGPYSYLIDNEDTMDSILQFEEYLTQQMSNVSLPLNIRVSLMICNGFHYVLYNNSKSRECVVAHVHEWRYVQSDEYTPKDYYLKYKFIYKNEQLEYPLNEFFQGLETKSYEERMSHVIQIGSFAWNDIGSIALWNTYNNKICVDTAYGVEVNATINSYNWFNEPVGFFVYDFEEYFMSVTDWFNVFNHSQLIDVNDKNMFFKNAKQWSNYMYDNKKMKYMMWVDANGTSIQCERDLYLHKMYEKRYTPLVYGFVRGFKQHNIPICLVELILLYFPFFVPLS